MAANKLKAVRTMGCGAAAYGLELEAA